MIALVRGLSSGPCRSSGAAALQLAIPAPSSSCGGAYDAPSRSYALLHMSCPAACFSGRGGAGAAAAGWEPMPPHAPAFMRQSFRGATKKAGGTASQKKPTIPKNLGIKMTSGELIFPGQIIVRQRGTKYHPGEGVGIGRDHTIFATRVGFVRFADDAYPLECGKNKERKLVSVEAIAAGEGVEQAMIARRNAIKRLLARGRVFEPALYSPSTHRGTGPAAAAATSS